MRPQPKSGRAREKSYPPHSMIRGSVDGLRRCKRQYANRLRQTHPLLKCLSSGAVDTGPMSDPLILWPTGQRMEQVDANAYIQRSFERSSVGQAIGQRANGPTFTPTHSFQRSTGSIMSMQITIFQGVMDAHPLEQPVCQRSTGKPALGVQMLLPDVRNYYGNSHPYPLPARGGRGREGAVDISRRTRQVFFVNRGLP